MKRILAALMALSISLLLSTCTQPPEPPAPDYLALMTAAAARADRLAGETAQRELSLQLQEQDGGELPLTYEELLLLAQYLQWRSGDYWLTEDYRLCVGEVMLNRVASPEFPDSLQAVLAEEGILEQVQGVGAPGKNMASLSLRLLLGERLLAPQVVHQCEEPVYTVYASFCDRRQHFTYFCESEFPRFYHLPVKKPDAQ